MDSLKIGFVGISHLSMNYMAAALKKGFSVHAFDYDKKLIKKVESKKLIYEEPNLNKVFQDYKSKIHFSNDFRLLRKMNIVYLSKDIKTGKNGNSKLNEIKKLIKLSLKFLKKSSTLIILSQVPPKFTRKIDFPKSKLYYQVETLVFGQAFKRALNPERIIVGCIDKSKIISKDYLFYLKKFNCPIIKMSYESAELTKISINLFLASTITSTNVLTKVCEKVDANWNDITPALKLDKRIGKHAYLKSGLGISGGNIERDITSIKKLLINEKDFRLWPNAIDKISTQMKSWVWNTLKKNNLLIRKNIIGILGLAYKVNTNSIKNSVSIELLKKIKNKIFFYDPKAKLNFKLKNCIELKKVELVCKQSNIIILMTPWPEFKFLNNQINILKRKKVIILDPYKLLKKEFFFKNKIKYFSIS